MYIVELNLSKKTNKQILNLGKFLANNMHVPEAFYPNRRLIYEDFKIEDSEDLEDALATRVEPELAYKVGSSISDIAIYIFDDLYDAAQNANTNVKNLFGSNLEEIVVEGIILAMELVVIKKHKTYKAIAHSIIRGIHSVLDDVAMDNDDLDFYFFY